MLKQQNDANDMRLPIAAECIIYNYEKSPTLLPPYQLLTKYHISPSPPLKGSTCGKARAEATPTRM